MVSSFRVQIFSQVRGGYGSLAKVQAMPGIYGQVRYQRGNYQPQGGGEPHGLSPEQGSPETYDSERIDSGETLGRGQASGRSQTRPRPGTVWIFAGRIAGRGVRWAVQEARQYPAWVQKVTTDAAGRFVAELVPGEYTVFAQDGDDLYLNRFAGDGQYAAVQVQAGEMTWVDLVNTSHAYC
jgi:hypothetical protein